MQILGKKKFFSIVEQSQILSNLGFEIAFSSYIKNPLREDTKPNCRYSENRKNKNKQTHKKSKEDRNSKNSYK